MTNSETNRRRIAVLGGGISGLTAAYSLARARQAGAPIEEFLVEASVRLGGSIGTEHVEGFLVEAGPDSFLAMKPEAIALSKELGLGDALLGSNDRERRTYILHNGRLVPLPDGLMLFIPSRLWPMLTTSLLPLSDKLAMLAEWFAAPTARNLADGGSPAPGEPPPRRVDQSSSDGQRQPIQRGDESVASFVRRHFGSAMVENIADPLLAGVFGGDAACLSLRSALPRIYELEQRYGSLIRGVVRDAGAGFKRAPREPTPLFMTLKDGLQSLLEELKKRLEGFRVHLGERVIAIEPATGSAAETLGPAPRSPAHGPVGPRYQIRCEAGGAAPRERCYRADAIILALPAYEGSRILTSLDGTLAELLRAIPYSSAVTVALGYDAGAASMLPPGFGFLVPRKEKRRILACTFVHVKFSHRAPPGRALLRCFLGGSRDPEVLDLTDDEILSLVGHELQTILKLSAKPLFMRIYRWPASMPQYVVGHEGRLATLQNRLENFPGLYLAGNAYTGVGIPDCIRTGKTAAERAVRDLSRENSSDPASQR